MDGIPLREGIDELLTRPETGAGEQTTDEEPELKDRRRPPKGSGWWGAGPPISTMRKGLARSLVDGGGLCSPGRWPPGRRRYPSGPTVSELRTALWNGYMVCVAKFEKGCAKRVFLRVACAQLDSSPFHDSDLAATREALRSILMRRGFDEGRPRRDDRPQKFEVRLIGELAKACADPDAMFSEFWARGVYIGSKGRRLPRTPAVFERKTKWKLADLDPLAQPEWRGNYGSTADHVGQVKKQFEAEAEMGFMTCTTLRQAIATYGDLLFLAALGAIEKKGDGEEVRVIYDATHGVLTNFLVKVRDLVRNPTAADIRAVMGEISAERTSHFTLVYDVSHAHRRIPVEEAEWGRLGCQLTGTAAEAYRAAVEDHKAREGGAAATPFSLSAVRFSEKQLSEEVWLNTVGTFGVGSAGYWWGRAGALMVRLAHYLVPAFLRQFWLLLYADDGKNTAGGDRREHPLLFHLFLLEVLGTPIKWKKVHGGIEVEWVGYWLDYRRFEMGISESRALWVRGWLDAKIRERRVALGELRGIGTPRVCYGPSRTPAPHAGPPVRLVSGGPEVCQAALAGHAPPPDGVYAGPAGRLPYDRVQRAGPGKRGALQAGRKSGRGRGVRGRLAVRRRPHH